jgi:hypothetical protein
VPGPWEKYGGAPQAGPMYGAPPLPPDQFKVRDQELQEEANRRAEEANRRAAEAANKPNLPAGYRMGAGDVAERIPGLPPAKGEGGQALPVAAATDYEGRVSALGDLERALNGFKPDYAGAGSGIESWAQGIAGVGTPGQRDWWADFKRTDNITRNILFGASLSGGEKAAYAETTITPNMKPDEVKRNLERRLQIARNVLRRKREFLVANGYNEQAINALDGGQFAEQARQPAQMAFGDQQPEEVPLPRLTPEQEQEYQQLLLSKPTPEQLMAKLAEWGLKGNANSLEEVAAAAQQGRINPAIDYSQSDAFVQKRLERERGTAGADDLLMHGATLGLSDEAAGVGRAAANVIASPFTGNFDPGGAYTQGRDEERIFLDSARQNSGGLGTVAEIGGSLASGGIGRVFTAAPSLGGRMAQGARAGAAGGAVAGFGYGQGMNSLLTAAGGAAGGAALGGAIPLGAEVVGNRVNGLMRLTGKDPQLPRKIVNDAIVADGNTPTAAGAMMDDAGTRGSPMMLADTGDNARGLLASVGRQPGQSKRLVRDAVQGRQDAQAERIASAVVRDLGPTANIREMGDELIERARDAARPLYEAAYSASGASSVKLDDLALRPSFRKALMKAANLAVEEGDNATALGFQFDEAGDVLLTEVPSFKTLDFIKRGMDDVVEGYRDSTTGKLNLNTGEARATNATLRTLIARMDKVNPDYAAARSAYAGPAKMRDALERGAKAFNKAPDDILAMMKNMGDAEKESFRLGVRKAITDLLASRRDGGDKVALLLGTPKSRQVLSQIFGGGKRFQRFIQTLRDEEKMGQTYKAVAGNSQTAERLAQDANTNDTGLAETAVDAALRGGKDGMWSAGIAAVQKLRDVGRFGAGEAGERTRENVAALLSETDPAVLRQLIAAANRAMSDQAARVGRQGRRAVQTGRNVGDFGGMVAGRTSSHEPK